MFSTDCDMPACVSSDSPSSKPAPNRNVTLPKAMMVAICFAPRPSAV
jgi:hypothetical protein